MSTGAVRVHRLRTGSLRAAGEVSFKELIGFLKGASIPHEAEVPLPLLPAAPHNAARNRCSLRAQGAVQMLKRLMQKCDEGAADHWLCTEEVRPRLCRWQRIVELQGIQDGAMAPITAARGC